MYIVGFHERETGGEKEGAGGAETEEANERKRDKEERSTEQWRGRERGMEKEEYKEIEGERAAADF